MNNKIVKKLRDKSGASMVFGLIGIMVAVVVSVLILTASTTAARRTRSDMKQVQSMLTVQSAAELIMNELANVQAKVRITEDIQDGMVKGKTYSADPSGITVSGRESFLSSEISKAFEEIGFTDYFPPKDYTAAFEISSGNMDTVTATFVMKHGNHAAEEETEDYEIIVSVTDGKTNMFVEAFVTSVVSSGGNAVISWNPTITSTK